MKIGVITQTNEKGQIVIPKRIRDQLGITPQVPLNVVVSGQSVYLYPLRSVSQRSESDQESYLSILKKAQGSWAAEDWGPLRKKRRAIELAASQRNKNAW